MNQHRSTILGLRPPGSMLASIQKYQDGIFNSTGNLSAIGVLPLIPLRRYSRIITAPKELRLDEPLIFSDPAEYRGSCFLPLTNPDALDFLTKELPSGYVVNDSDENLLYPLFPGIFICRGIAPPGLSAFGSGKEGFRSASFSAVLVEYRYAQPENGWWNSIEERTHWELQVRKPVQTRRKRNN